MSAFVQKINMLILMQPDIVKAIAFYQQLGLKLVFQIKDTWAEMQLGDIKIGLCPIAEKPTHVCRTGIVLQVTDMKDAYESLRDTITFLSEPKEAIHGIMVSFQDPGNNVLDLYQPTPAKVLELVKQTAAQGESSSCSDKPRGTCCRKTNPC